MSTSKTHYLPNYINFYNANSIESLAFAMSENIGFILEKAIKKKGYASLAVSGGRTPKFLFEELSQLNLNWSKIELTLVDDRWVDSNHEDSNEFLVRTHLIKNKASKVKFLPLKNKNKTAKSGHKFIEKNFKQMNLPLDVVVLGMGLDGHTASLFPCSKEIIKGLSRSNSDNLIAVIPKNYPYERISLTAQVILKAENLMLLINGSDKLHTLKNAMECKDEKKMPIYTFLQSELNIYWCP